MEKRVEGKRASEERRDPENAAQRKALEALIKERDYQRERWKEDRAKGPGDWHTILSVWLGKLAQETPLYQGIDGFDKAKFLKRLIQLGAIAVAAHEAASDEETPGTT